VHIIRISTGELIFEYEGCFYSFSPDSNCCAVFDCVERKVRIVRVITGEQIFECNGYFRSFSPDGNCIVVETGESFSGTPSTSLFSISMNREVFACDGRFLSFSPDGNYIAIYDYKVHKTILFRISTGVRVFDCDGEFKSFSPGGDCFVVYEFSKLCAFHVRKGLFLWEKDRLYGIPDPIDSFANGCMIFKSAYIENNVCSVVDLLSVRCNAAELSPDQKLFVLKIFKLGYGIDREHVKNLYDVYESLPEDVKQWRVTDGQTIENIVVKRLDGWFAPVARGD
jgi:hypothetical protein